METRFIKRYFDFVLESKSNDLIVKKGEELFHGTVEDFDIKDIRPGGYDGILWTSKYPAISQSYIPVSGSSMLTKTSYFHRPEFHENQRQLQRQLGFNYDYDHVKFDDRNRATSWKTPLEWKEESDKAWHWAEAHRKLGEEIKKKRKEYEEFNNHFIDNHKTIQGEEREEFKRKQIELRKELFELEQKYDEQSKEWHDKGDSKKFEYEFINNALRKLGYEPDDTYSTGNDYSWDLKMGFDQNKNQIILPANYRAEGRLLIIKPKEDLKIFDYAKGRESDMMDLDYHKLDLFKKVEKEGYDGIRINDFAQIEGEGNFGHDSIGLFESTIPKLDIVSIPAVHPENFYKNHAEPRDYDTKEYKKYISSNK
jgi:hypothetical protein